MQGVSIALTILGLAGLSTTGVCGEDEKTQREMMVHENETRGIAPAATSTNKIVVGVLDLEASGTAKDPSMET